MEILFIKHLLCELDVADGIELTAGTARFPPAGRVQGGVNNAHKPLPATSQAAAPLPGEGIIITSPR